MPASRRPPPGRGASRGRQAPQGRQARQGRQAPRGPKPERQGSDLFARIVVAVPAAVVAIVLIDVGGTAWMVFMIALGCVAMQELYQMLARWKPVPLLGFAAMIGIGIAARYGGLRDVLEVAVAAVPVLFVFIVLRGQSAGATVSIAGTLLGIYWIGFAFGHAILLRQVHHGNGILIDIAVGTFLGDTAAYLGGRMFGRRPLAPEISPKKTVEGLFCGMFVSVLAVFFAGIYQNWLTQGDAFLLGIAVAVLGPMGDLFESLVKRDAGAKDAGSLFGAHGGALDRLDGVMFTVVAGYYIWIAVPHPFSV